LKQERRKVEAVGKDEREKLRAEIREAAEKLEAVRHLHTGDPVAVLKRSSYGSEKARLYREALAGAGPAELEEALQTALLRGDKDLAAAAVQRVQGLGRDMRSQIRTDFREVAKHLTRAEVDRCTRNILVAEIAAERAAHAELESYGRKVHPNRKMRLGAKVRELTALVGETPDGDAP
jgi:hypothetical protein